jgi:hypothetical protein
MLAERRASAFDPTPMFHLAEAELMTLPCFIAPAHVLPIS